MSCHGDCKDSCQDGAERKECQDSIRTEVSEKSRTDETADGEAHLRQSEQHGAIVIRKFADIGRVEHKHGCDSDLNTGVDELCHSTEPKMWGEERCTSYELSGSLTFSCHLSLFIELWDIRKAKHDGNAKYTASNADVCPLY